MMTMDATPRWGLPLLFAGQAQKELFHNEALTRIDALMHGQVQSAAMSAPPADPAIGQCWIVGSGAGGEWAGHEDDIACWTEGGWRFLIPAAGVSLWTADLGHVLRHDGSAWRADALRPDGVYVDDLRIVGARLPAVAGPTGGATVDAEARGAIDAILGVLRTHGLIAA